MARKKRKSESTIAPDRTRYLIYARVSERGSTWKADESSVEQQVQACRRWVEFHGGSIVRVVRDEFKTGADTVRPGMTSVISQLEAGTQDFDALIVRDLARLTRDMRDGIDVRDLLAERQCGLVSIAENIDFSTPIGRVFFAQSISMGQYQREVIARDTRQKMYHMAKAGKWPPGKPPFGYRKTPELRLEPHPDKADIVRDVFRRYCAGESTTEIRRVHPMASTTISQILRNRVYLGHIIYGDVITLNAHEPLVSQDMYDLAQARLPGTRSTPRPNRQTRTYLLQGMLYSPSGAAMTPYSTRPRGKRYYYYQSTSEADKPARYNADEIEAAVLRDLTTWPDDLESIMQSIKEDLVEREELRVKYSAQLTDITSAFAAADDEAKSIERMFTSGIVTADNMAHWNNKLANIRVRIHELEAERDDVTPMAKPINPDSLARAIQRHIREMRHQLSNQDDRDLVRSILRNCVQRIDLIGDYELDIQLNPGLSNASGWQPRLKLIIRWSHDFSRQRLG